MSHIAAQEKTEDKFTSENERPDHVFLQLHRVSWVHVWAAAHADQLFRPLTHEMITYHLQNIAERRCGQQVYRVKERKIK